MANQMSVSFYHVDPDRETRQEIPMETQPLDYIEGLFKLVQEKASKKRFRFCDENKGIRSDYEQYLTGSLNFDALSDAVANQLLSAEITAQKKITQLARRIKRGALLHAIRNHEGQVQHLLAKIDVAEYLDEHDLQKHLGLPYTKQTYRAALLTHEQGDMEIHQISIFDSKPKLTVYWWQDFLGLDEIHNDEYNTDLAYTRIKAQIGRSISKNKCKSDHTHIMNALKVYFRGRKSFDIHEFVTTLLGDYEPTDPGLDKDKIKERILALPEKHDFDERFAIHQDAIKIKRETISLADNVELVLRGAVTQLGDTIIAKRIDGEDGIFIISDEGYERFRK